MYINIYTYLYIFIYKCIYIYMLYSKVPGMMIEQSVMKFKKQYEKLFGDFQD